MEFIFITSVCLLLYIYFGYPLLLLLLSQILKKSVKINDFNPAVSVLISAYNEENVIRKTLENKLDSNYPKELLEVIVVSDESVDKTDEIVKEFNNKNVKLIRQIPRKGKTSALNLAVKKANGEIIIFSDANSIYQKDTIKILINNFSDKEVGYVTGKMIYVNNDGSTIGDGCSVYMRYENKLREYETNIGSIIGVDGGIDAMRKELYENLENDQLPDFVQPLHVLKKGFRVIFEQKALLEEHALKDYQSEIKMRIRVSLRALWALFDMRVLMNPFKYPLISFQIISHKLLRYLAWAPIVIALLSNMLLLSTSYIYITIFIFQMLFYTCVIMGSIIAHKENIPKFITVPYYFFIINYAAAAALMKFMKGEKIIVWTPRVG